MGRLVVGDVVYRRRSLVGDVPMAALVVDLFAGPGGWDEGARLAGYTGPIVGLETDPDACATARAAGHDRLQVDVATTDPTDFAGTTGLIASPPCQSFSQAGSRGGIDDDRGALVWEPLRWVRALTPEWFAFEQVPEVLPIWRIIAAALRELGYSVWTGLLNSADYGVPQTRIRAAAIGRLHGVALPPEPTHAKLDGDDLFGSQLKSWITMADALGWSEDVAYRRTRGTGLIERHGERPDTPCSQPAPTITGKSRCDLWVMARPAATVLGDPRIGRPGHKNRDKGEAQVQNGSVPVSVEEAAVLQSFRADYPFRGSKTSRHQQVGNAVPPLLAAAILRPLLPKPPILIDFGDNDPDQWDREPRPDQLALPIDLPPTVPARIPPPYAPRGRRIDTGETKEDLL